MHCKSEGPSVLVKLVKGKPNDAPLILVDLPFTILDLESI